MAIPTPLTGARIAACAARSARGVRRENNEDAILVAGTLLAVADGVGGHEGGEDASALTVAALRQTFPAEPDDPQAAFGAALGTANTMVRAAAQRRGLDAMASTIVAAHVSDHGLTVAHAGDSRAYLWHDGDLERLTHDHSLVAELREREEITAEQARRHPLRSMILRAVGIADELRPTITTVPAAPGDVLILCSDGVSDPLGDAGIARALGETRDPERLADLLVFRARETSGDDTSVVVALLG